MTSDTLNQYISNFQELGSSNFKFKVQSLSQYFRLYLEKLERTSWKMMLKPVGTIITYNMFKTRFF